MVIFCKVNVSLFHSFYLIEQRGEPLLKSSLSVLRDVFVQESTQTPGGILLWLVPKYIQVLRLKGKMCIYYEYT